MLARLRHDARGRLATVSQDGNLKGTYTYNSPRPDRPSAFQRGRESAAPTKINSWRPAWSPTRARLF
ncbi:MAG: hypothetical protein CTY20_08760 [Hyphomicrobium sp.]|nr:MAG: hypothetical protein CTY20_08760 [Hyphomicrobium sp.]